MATVVSKWEMEHERSLADDLSCDSEGGSVGRRESSARDKDQEFRFKALGAATTITAKTAEISVTS